jgi:glucosamine 6-phosphate synthetase-like amidotransferase/phosphosugar isomerase protein
MCGIIGAFSFGEIDEKLEKKRKDIVSYMVTELLLLSLERGSDATGIATLFDDGNFMGLKMGVSSLEFVSRFGKTDKDYEGFLKTWKKYDHVCRAVLGHCRKSSVGKNNYDNANNHPIRVEDVVGVHNGTLKNHSVIFKKLGCERDGEVDSEAIIRFAHYLTKNGTEPFTLDMIQEMAERLEGSFASLIFSGNNPFQIAGLRRDRPIEMVLVRPLKTIFVASEKKFLEKVIWKMKLITKLHDIRKLIDLKDEDIDFCSIINDYMFLMDLTKEVDKDTDIKDLFEEKKMPYTVKAEWKDTYTTTTYNKPTTTTKTTTPATGSALVSSTEKKGANSTDGLKNTAGQASGDSTEGVALLWNKALQKFQPEADTSKTDKMGNVEVNVDNGKVVEVEKGKAVEKETTDFEIVESSATSEELITSEAEIKEHQTNSNIDDDDVVDIEKVDVIEVDSSELCPDPEALEQARKATDSLNSYESEEETLEGLAIESKEIAKSLSLIALVNRAKRIFYRLGFYDGYLARKNETTEKSTGRNERQKEKEKSREKNIRILKVFSNTLTRIIRHRDVAVNLDKAVDQEVASALERRDELDPKVLAELFSEGELKKDVVLEKITRTIEEKSKR